MRQAGTADDGRPAQGSPPPLSLRAPPSTSASDAAGVVGEALEGDAPLALLRSMGPPSALTRLAAAMGHATTADSAPPSPAPPSAALASTQAVPGSEGGAGGVHGSPPRSALPDTTGQYAGGRHIGEAPSWPGYSDAGAGGDVCGELATPLVAPPSSGLSNTKAAKAARRNRPAVAAAHESAVSMQVLPGMPPPVVPLFSRNAGETPGEPSPSSMYAAATAATLLSPPEAALLDSNNLPTLPCVQGHAFTPNAQRLWRVGAAPPPATHWALQPLPFRPGLAVLHGAALSGEPSRPALHGTTSTGSSVPSVVTPQAMGCPAPPDRGHAHDKAAFTTPMVTASTLSSARMLPASTAWDLAAALRAAAAASLRNLAADRGRRRPPAPPTLAALAPALATLPPTPPLQSSNPLAHTSHPFAPLVVALASFVRVRFGQWLDDLVDAADVVGDTSGTALALAAGGGMHAPLPPPQ